MSAYKFYVHGVDYVVYGSKPGRWFVRQRWDSNGEVLSGPHKTRAAAIRHTTEALIRTPVVEAWEARKQIQEAEKREHELARAERRAQREARDVMQPRQRLETIETSKYGE